MNRSHWAKALLRPIIKPFLRQTNSTLNHIEEPPPKWPITRRSMIGPVKMTMVQLSDECHHYVHWFNDVSNIFSEWKTKFSTLERDNKKLHDEFNIQRAKMKDLFILKESKCFKTFERLCLSPGILFSLHGLGYRKYGKLQASDWI